MIVVLGGGITGLAVARELDARGLEFVVLERDLEPGGVIRSGEVAGRVLDWGPQRLRLTPRIARLIQELELEDELVVAPEGLELFVYRNGRLNPVPRSPAQLLTSSVISTRGKVRLAIEPFTAGAKSGERVSTYFSRKLGPEAYEAVVGPLFGGLYASDPADMEVGVALAPMLEALGIERSLLVAWLRRRGGTGEPRACTFRGGMQTLPGALAAALGNRVRLGTAARAVRAGGGGLAVELEDSTMTCRAVVITTPASVTAGLLERVAPAVASAVGSLRYNPLAVVHLEAEAGPPGYGFQVAFTEPELMLRGVTFNHSLFGRRNLYTAYLGGAQHPETAELDERSLGERARQDFRRCTGLESEILAVHRVRIPAWDRSWQAIGDLVPPPGIHFAASWWSRPGIPGRLEEARRVARELEAYVRA